MPRYNKNRYYGPIRSADLRKLRDITLRERERFFESNPRWSAPYYDQLLAICICQGAALHFVDGRTGVKDFDVFLFYGEHPSIQFPTIARTAKESGISRMGVLGEDRKRGYRTRRIDLFYFYGRTIPMDLVGSGRSVVSPIRRYLIAGRTRTARELARKAVVGLWPDSIFGGVIWPPWASIQMGQHRDYTDAVEGRGLPAHRPSNRRGDGDLGEAGMAEVDERERRVRELMEAFGMNEQQARFAAAIEAGEISGDVVALDPETGAEVEDR